MESRRWNARRRDALVTVAIPTFNRADLLKDAVASVLAQDYPMLDICIIDNHSTDGTYRLCEEFAAADSRVRCIRQPQNVGPVRNFETGLEEARGEYFLWLADDDWIDPEYVRLCLDALESTDHILVVGRDYWHSGERVLPERVVEALHPDAATRVLYYMRDLASNAAVYGMARTADLRANLPFPRKINGDVVWVGKLIERGTLGVVPEVGLHRRVGGSSTDLRPLAEQLDGGRFSRRFPRVAIPVETVRGLLNAHVLAGCPLGTRLSVMVRIGLIMWVKAGSGDEMTAFSRSVVARVIPAAMYDLLRRAYRPVRRAQSVARQIILEPRASPAQSGNDERARRAGAGV